MAKPYFLHNLVPHREKRSHTTRPLLRVLASLTFIQYAHFFSGWLAWTCDALDFFSVSLSVTALGKEFGRSTHDITTSITLTLLLRSAGALIFGILSDRYGRKWPLVVNLIIISVLELGAGFVHTYSSFLGLRALFGIGMGGVWGMAASTSLENLPVEARGLASGVLQQGYAVGYLIAAIVNLYLVPESPQGWRTLFWTASGISLFAAAVRAVLPESEVFLKAARAEKEREQHSEKQSKTKMFMRETKTMLRKHWRLCIYAVFLMTGFNFLSHGSQDLYPTYLRDTKNFSEHNATVATIIGNCGAIAGGVFAGYISQYMGRRLTIICMVLLIAVFIPLWILPSSFSALSAGAFCIQFGVQGAWGVIPIFLSEMSPPAFRATFAGVAYQLGNMVSSASAQIEATGGEHQRTTILKPSESNPSVLEPEDAPDYAKVQGILIGVVAAFVICVTILGPEHLGTRFENAKKGWEEGAGKDDASIYEESIYDRGEREDGAVDAEMKPGAKNDVNEVEREKTSDRSSSRGVVDEKV